MVLGALKSLEIHHHVPDRDPSVERPVDDERERAEKAQYGDDLGQKLRNCPFTEKVQFLSAELIAQIRKSGSEQGPKIKEAQLFCMGFSCDQPIVIVCLPLQRCLADVAIRKAFRNI